VSSRVFLSLSYPVHSSPAAHDALDMVGRAGAPYRQQPFFGLRRGDAGQSADLGVRELAAGEGLGQERQRSQGSRHADAFTGCAQVEPHSPTQPAGAGAKAGVRLAAEEPNARALVGRAVGSDAEDVGARAVGEARHTRRASNVSRPSALWASTVGGAPGETFVTVTPRRTSAPAAAARGDRNCDRTPTSEPRGRPSLLAADAVPKLSLALQNENARAALGHGFAQRRAGR